VIVVTSFVTFMSSFVIVVTSFVIFVMPS